MPSSSRARPPLPGLQSTMLISLLQPSPETFELFDDVMLMSHGRIVFLVGARSGPRVALGHSCIGV